MTFTYEAKDDNGRTVTGAIDAENERAAATRVREMGYFPMRFSKTGTAPTGFTKTRGPGLANAPAGEGVLQPSALTDLGTWRSENIPSAPFVANPFPQKPYGSFVARHFVFPIATGVSLRDKAIFYREFAAMLNAGVPIVRCLQAMAEGMPGGLLRTAVRRMERRVDAGDTVSGAMGEFPYLFDDLQLAMVRAAEESGGLDLMMTRIADYLEADFELRQMIKRETFQTKATFVVSLFVPPLVIAVTQGVGAYMTQVVEPVIQMALTLALIYGAGRLSFQSNVLRVAYDTIKAHLPYFGTTVRILALAKFSRAFASLYASGVLIPRALAVSSRVSGNAFLAQKIEQATSRIMSGMGLTEALRSTGSFPPIFLSMVGTGETSGNLDQMLNKIADFYEDEGKTRLQQSVKTGTILLFLALAVYVGMIVIKAYTGYGNQIQELTNFNP